MICIPQAFDLILVVAENASTLHCCWHHYTSLSVDHFLAEIFGFLDCLGLFDTIEFLQAVQCPHVKFFQQQRFDLPPSKTAIYDAKCESLSKNVKISRDDYLVTCQWINGHFDTGFNAAFPTEVAKNGFMHQKLCREIQDQCQVIVMLHTHTYTYT